MIPLASLRAGCRRAALLCISVVVLLSPASAVQAQRLLTLVPGVGQAASAGDLGPSIGPAPTAVQVDLELLRSAPARLEVPTPDGSVLSAVQSVFEDRGGGDLMWSGGQPGAGYDTVVLTVEGGRLVGRFGAAGGGAYQIHAERDGRGGMAPVVGPGLEEWCGVEAGAEDGHDAHAHFAAEALAADPPRRVSNPQSHDRLDILVAYTATAAENWADRGGALAAIRHAGDYLKMVFRNNNLPVEPHIVHIAQASTALDRAGRDLRVPRTGLMGLIQNDGDLSRLRHEHRADLVHLFTGEGPALLGNPCGQHFPLSKGYTARRFSYGGTYGWTSNSALCDYVATFVHELGHGLGTNHEPAATKFPDTAYRPYAFAYVDRDVMPSIGTATVTGAGQIEPFFSTPRIRPYGAVVGIADSQDNERTLQETVHMGARYSDYFRSLEGVPAQPSNLRVWLDGESARLAWQDNAPDADGYEVWFSGWNVDSGWSNPGTALLVEGRAGATIPLEYTEPGTVYVFDVQAIKGEERSLEAGWEWLAFPDELEAPSDVSVAASDARIDVEWADNSDNEEGFVVHVLDDGEPVARKWAWADRTSAEILRFRIWPQDREYQVRVYAANSSAYSEGSEAVTFRWTHPLAPAAVTDLVASAIAPTTARLTWTGNSESDYYVVDARLPGWLHHVFPIETEWLDIEGLARGGRYTFEVIASNRDRDSVSSWAYLTLGARGTGPAAPSNLAWVPEGEEGHWGRLSWKDNSRDELGFEVQSRSFRLATVPPDTESAVIPIGSLHAGAGGVRVYAYNERGFSARSNRVSSGPGLRGLIATAGDTEAELRWDMWSAEAVTGMQVRWRATADLPFDDAVDTWTDLPASARAYTATGLKNGTKYMFAVRYVTASGAGPTVSTAATPRDLPSPPRVPPKASFVVSVDCFDDPCRVRTGEEIRLTDTSSGNVTKRHWSFGDGATSDLKSPTHAWTTPGLYDVTLTVSDGSSSDSAIRTLLVGASAPSGSCRADAETLCLQDSRFEVKVNWWKADGESGVGRVVEAGTSDSGLFQFFDPLNWEVLIKVLDGCRTNGRIWVLGASTTDLGYRIVVTDTVTGESRSYVNEPGRPAPAIVDTQAFSVPCRGGAGP